VSAGADRSDLTRIDNVITNSGLTVEQFAELSDTSLLRMPNFGRKSLALFRRQHPRPRKHDLSERLKDFTDADLYEELDRRHSAKAAE
jgi:hypothetical protein